MKALLLANIALLALLGWESLPAADEAPVDVPIAATQATTKAAPPPPVADWTRLVLARPLFAQDRRPPQTAKPAAAAAEVLPRLTGTIRTDDRLLAIFAPAGSGPPIVVARDGTVAGWTVTDIADGAVTLDRDGSALIVRLGFDKSAVTAAAPPSQTLVLLHERRTNPFLQP
jgi:hypothetical protein